MFSKVCYGKAQVILNLGLRLCGVNEVFDSEVFVYPNRKQRVFVQVLYHCADALRYVEDDDENNETRALHLI